MVDPPLPAFFRNAIVDLLAELARIRREVEALRSWKPSGAFEEIPDAKGFRYLPEVSARADGAVDISVTVGWGASGENGLTVTVQGVRGS